MTAAEIISIITAVTALVAAVGVVLVNLKTAKVASSVTSVQEDVSHVKVLVNSAKEASDTYQADLIQALRSANVAVPVDQSVILSEPSRTTWTEPTHAA
jgi:hypothetical protein